MKTFLTALTSLISALSAFAADIKPTGTGAPLFQIFEAQPKYTLTLSAEANPNGPPQFGYDPKSPLLTVKTVRDLILADDKKGITLWLNDKDSQTWAEVTHKFDGKFLILISSDTGAKPAASIMHISAPIEDGYLDFTGPYKTEVAEYLRRRFPFSEAWITGEVVIRKDVLLFRSDKPVGNNTTTKVVLLDAAKATANFLMPLYRKAAEKHIKLRLYGMLVPEGNPAHPNSPNIRFVTRKLHSPTDPDELPPDKKIIIHPEDAVRFNAEGAQSDSSGR